MLFDTETNGLMDYKRPADAPGQPRVAEFAAILTDHRGNVLHEFQRYIKPPMIDGVPEWTMTPEATEINGITDEMLQAEGVPIGIVLDFWQRQVLARYVPTAYGAQFDCKMMRSELRRAELDDLFEQTPNVCIMRAARPFAKQIGREIIKAGGNNKGWPKLSDLCAFLGVPQQKEHGGLDDTRSLAACFKQMLELGFEPRPEVHHAKNYEEIRSTP